MFARSWRLKFTYRHIIMLFSIRMKLEAGLLQYDLNNLTARGAEMLKEQAASQDQSDISQDMSISSSPP